MIASSRRRWMWGSLGVLAVAGIVAAVLIGRRENERDSGAGGKVPARIAPDSASAADAGIPPLPDSKAFAHLPPAGRINAETRARMERNAAWSEKLRAGDYSTLPPEAYPSPSPSPVPPSPSP